ncbi:GNAT family N-acetyltransferase [Nostoc sp. GT001]|uniref:DUF6610 family protein n=1 Tax=Nostoc sp. GT001 TaxID=3056647 RepID=UPI0025AA8010|nr:GNAT family N-acetyltransferase [Nostoc sp. GT001]MDM9583077.1 GNAT family N-acetyltransferase [Nostoc sp. GT001]
MTELAAPNLGKFFTSCTKRPATAEDITLLQVGDWISEKECPWSFQFKRWDGNMCIGAWEEKEFPIPRHLLMVCQIIEGQVVEKFFRSEVVASYKIFNKLINQLGFTSIFELSDLTFELVEDFGVCAYYVRKKDTQVTIRKLAVLPQHQKQGWGRLLIYRVICKAIEQQKTSIFLKCPADLSANDFYKNLGFELEATEQDRTRPLNHWRYHIKLPLLFYCGGGGKSKYDAIATEHGWNLGINSSGKNKSHQHMMMIDNDWENYDHEKHLAMVKQNKPLIATARDIEHPDQLPEILDQATELAKYAGRVLLIPKCDVTLPDSYWLGYSVESGYGKTDLKPEWFGKRPVHLLGGSPKKTSTSVSSDERNQS